MSFETSLRLVVAGCLLLNAADNWRRSRSPAALVKLGEQFARRNLAEVEGHFVPFIDDRNRRLSRFKAGVSAVGSLGVLVVPFDWLATPASCVALGLVVASLALQSAWEASRPLGLDASSARTARLRVVGVTDLVRPWVRSGSWAGTLAVSSGGALMIFRGNVPDDERALLVAGIAALLTAAGVTETSAHRVCQAPAPAGDAAQLYWQDALRGDSVGRGYASVLMAAGLMCSAVGTSLDGAELRSSGFWLAGGVMLLGCGAQALWADDRAPWFRERLWSSLADGEVVRPGRQRVP